MSDDPRLSGFTDDTLKRVLQRAIELDTIAGSRVSEAELRAIAQELGVSTHSLEAAIREMSDSASGISAPQASPAPKKERSLLIPALCGAAAGAVFTVGLQAAGMDMSGPGLTAVIVMRIGGFAVAVASASAIWRARDRDQRAFHAGNTMIWLGALVGLLFAARLSASSDVAARVAMALIVQGWMGSTIIGTIVGAMQFRRRTTSGGAPPSDGSASGPTSSEPRRSGWRDFMEKLIPWFESTRMHFHRLMPNTR